MTAARTFPTAVLLLSLSLPGGSPVPPPADPPESPGGACAFQEIDVDRWGRQPFRNPPEWRAKEGRVSGTLEVRYTDPATTSIAGCPVTLRTYNGALVGPTMRVPAGGVLAFVLDNRLPRETPQQVADQYRQEAENAFLGTRPHSFNTTNVHTHGLHVSPLGNSDNVLLAIPAQTRFPYEVKVPADHPRGTFWYHAHPHGGTAIQVGSGMAGALIVEDDETRIPAALREANRREKVFVFQTILYDTAGRVDDIEAFFPDSPATDSLCKAGNSGCTWQNSMRRTTINGQIVPVIRMRPGEVQRWRFIDAAFRESLHLRLEGHALHEIAVDGIYLGRVDTWGPGQTIELQPGYRSDVLVKASSRPGVYRLVDDTASAPRALRGVAEDATVLAELVVEGDPLDMRLPSSAEMAALNPFPGVDLKAEADGVQEAVFKLGSAADPSDERNYFQINYQAFDPGRVRYLRLGATDMWSLTTVGDPAVLNGIPPLPHVFHIHVNPFQVTRKDPAGKEETVWKDTILVPPDSTVTMYTKYVDYIGQFVIHCHILDHEDLGMMEVVEIVGEDGPLPPPVLSHGPHGGARLAGGAAGQEDDVR